MGHSDYDDTDYDSLAKIQRETKGSNQTHESSLDVQEKMTKKVKEHNSLT